MEGRSDHRGSTQSRPVSNRHHECELSSAGPARRFHGPADNQRLCAADWAVIERRIDAVESLRRSRSAWLAANGLDAALHLPGHMWDADFVDVNYRKLVRKDRHTIEHLRCLTYNFTGFSLLTMAPCTEHPDVPEVPPDADAILRAHADRAAAVADSFVAITSGMPRERVVAAPRLFAESGIDVDGSIVNCDTWATQQRLNGLHHSGVLDHLQRAVRRRGFARVVEIGAGYGNLAHALTTAIGPIDYTIIDLPESLIYSSIYLPVTLPAVPHTLVQPGQQLPAAGPGITYLGNHLLPVFLPQLGEVDLVVNMLSLSEMSPAQVAHYGAAARRLIGTDGVFHEQNYMEPGVQTDIVSILRGIFGYAALLQETPNPHRGRGEARQWTNRYHGALWNRGGVRPIPTAAAPAPTCTDRQHALTPSQ
jgi:hypothetical protein